MFGDACLHLLSIRMPTVLRATIEVLLGDLRDDSRDRARPPCGAKHLDDGGMQIHSFLPRPPGRDAQPDLMGSHTLQREPDGSKAAGAYTRWHRARAGKAIIARGRVSGAVVPGTSLSTLQAFVRAPARCWRRCPAPVAA